MSDVVAGTGDLDQPEITLDHDDLCCRSNPGQAEPCRDLAFVDLAGAAEARLFGMLQHQKIEAAGIGEHPAHDERIGDRLDPVGKAERAIRRQEAHLGQLAPLEPLGRCGVGVDFGELDLAGAAGEELDDRDIIDRRIGVRQGDHRRHTTRRGGAPAALDRFQVLRTRLAQLHPHIDEPRRQAQPLGHHRLGIARRSREVAADGGDPLALDQEIARCVEPACGVEQPGAVDQKAVHATAQFRPLPSRPFRRTRACACRVAHPRCARGPSLSPLAGRELG